MKLKNYIAVLLATYLFALMLLPCADHCELNEGDLNFQSAQEHHKDKNDLCSPFCFCACCSTIVTVMDFPSTNFFVDSSIHQFQNFVQLFLSTEHSFIWQPPKIS